ncbi:helix-turn-helix domain-containing protein [Chitinimonas sp. PSY-7]|uniref:helix-turn-helix domain-containing protein n=1 Tax=Chitinimonas sp. PSY-7 TaxID=3459088 RepID=UPI00403FEC92
MTFPARLKEALAESPFSQGEVARRAGISPGTVTMWKNGTIMHPEARHIASISRVLGVHSDWLIDGKKPKRPGDLADPHEAVVAPPGFVTLTIPEALSPLVNAWADLCLTTPVNPAVLESVTGLANSLNPALNRHRTVPQKGRRSK